jgi:hypothetical protein
MGFFFASRAISMSVFMAWPPANGRFAT